MPPPPPEEFSWIAYCSTRWYIFCDGHYLAYGWRAWNFNQPIRIQKAGKAILSCTSSTVKRNVSKQYSKPSLTRFCAAIDEVNQFVCTEWPHLSLKMAPKTVGTTLDQSLCSLYCLKSAKAMLLPPLWITSWEPAYSMNCNQLFAQGTPPSPLWSV